MADAYEVNVAAHNSSGPLSTVISGHFCSVVPNLRTMEIDMDEVPWRPKLLTNPYRVENGEFILPSGPGWGTDIDEDVARAHAIASKDSDRRLGGVADGAAWLAKIGSPISRISMPSFDSMSALSRGSSRKAECCRSSSPSTRPAPPVTNATWRPGRGAISRTRAGRELEQRNLDAALGERAQRLDRQAVLVGLLPVEILRPHHDRLVVARLRIFELALIDVLPDRLEAVLVAALTRRRSPLR